MYKHALANCKISHVLSNYSQEDVSLVALRTIIYIDILCSRSLEAQYIKLICSVPLVFLDVAAGVIYTMVILLTHTHMYKEKEIQYFVSTSTRENP
jgi:hypothetical protein